MLTTDMFNNELGTCSLKLLLLPTEPAAKVIWDLLAVANSLLALFTLGFVLLSF